MNYPLHLAQQLLTSSNVSSEQVSHTPVFNRPAFLSYAAWVTRKEVQRENQV